jgi:hypothetical protein
MEGAFCVVPCRSDTPEFMGLERSEFKFEVVLPYCGLWHRIMHAVERPLPCSQRNRMTSHGHGMPVFTFNSTVIIFFVCF